ncbi:MAG TPA: 2-phospho-L-lactate transferase CofD family protein, partial [Bacilli bacterium]|nr:2-phospho-L-lactate transferase CofD family protein [Bacilli bacterium]
KVIGEENVTYANKNIISLEYDKDVSISSDIAKAIKTADLIIFSSGSLLTSIIPNLLVKGITDEIKASKAKKMYVCNLVTQPGETNDFKASDHIKLLEKFLGNGVIDVILANDGKISDYIKKKYASLEQKDPVKLDESTLKRMNVSIIKDKIWKIEDNVLRHDSLKTAYLIFSYLMEGE